MGWSNLIYSPFLVRTKDKTDLDVLRENHRFLWRDEDEDDMTWWSFTVKHSCGMFSYSACFWLLSPGNICLQMNYYDTCFELLTWLPALFCSREKELAKKYYDKLFKEYCIADLSRYKENKVGLTKEQQNSCSRHLVHMTAQTIACVVWWLVTSLTLQL